jgi:peptide/nickel transport system permease protein
VSTAQVYQAETSDALITELAPRRSLWQVVRTHPRILVAGALLLGLVVISILAPWISPQNPITVNIDAARLPPGPGHWLGTDELGRDELSRVIWGGRISLPVAAVAVSIGLFTGCTVGITAGYRGGLTDLLLMRVIDALLAFPALILAIAIVAALGPSLVNAMIAIGIVQIPVYARLSRAQVLQTKNLDFITAARALGAGPARLIARHFVPNLLNPIIIQVSLSSAFAILAEATLSFLGLGARPPTPDWGFMINTGGRFLFNNAWWMTVAPALAISIAVFGFNWLGDALRDALDPRLRDR